MKRLLIALLSLAAFSAKAAITVTANGGEATTGATNATSLSVTITAPDLTDGKFHYLMAAVCSTLTPSVTSDAGYSWQQYGIMATNGTPAYLYVARVFSGAGTTITFTTSSTAATAAIVAEFKSDSPLRMDRTITSTGSSAAPSSGTTSSTTTASEIAIAALGHRCTGVAATPTGTFSAITNSFTEISAGGYSTYVTTANNDREVDLVYKILSSTAAQSVAATVAVTNNWGGVMMTFEEIAATGGQHSSVY